MACWLPVGGSLKQSCLPWGDTQKTVWGGHVNVHPAQQIDCNFTTAQPPTCGYITKLPVQMQQMASTIDTCMTNAQQTNTTSSLVSLIY